MPWRSRPEALQTSPVLRCLCAQDDLEPVLRTHAALAGAEGAAWREAAGAAARELAVPLAAFTVGAGGDLGDPEKRWAELYGVTSEGVVLVRPDGHVAWGRAAATPGPRGELAAALRQVTRTSLS